MTPPPRGTCGSSRPPSRTTTRSSGRTTRLRRGGGRRRPEAIPFGADISGRADALSWRPPMRRAGSGSGAAAEGFSAESTRDAGAPGPRLILTSVGKTGGSSWSMRAPLGGRGREIAAPWRSARSNRCESPSGAWPRWTCPSPSARPWSDSEPLRRDRVVAMDLVGSTGPMPRHLHARSSPRSAAHHRVGERPWCPPRGLVARCGNRSSRPGASPTRTCATAVLGMDPAGIVVAV
jgi:hypothetical protein